ncbi:MAG: hypothetical protein HYR72_09350 [Deltaproteobacteria bacterium]|nr:hypothetical protein [Deltaproteobacteria bacterium]MBI3388963.1 hypothetical protein [Deltaproteobacteria bacterium]
MTTLPIVAEPSLIEEAVLRRIAGHSAERPFRRERDRLYLITNEAKREQTFQQFHQRWFAQLELGGPIDAALGELPILAQTCVRCFVTRAALPSDEGADLLVASDGSICERTVLIRLRVVSFDDPVALLTLLRFELLHVADMADAAFGYEPTLPSVDGGPSYERLLRDRYRALWNVSIAGRLHRRGVASPDAKAVAHRGFVAAFPGLGDAEADETFEHFFDSTTCSHADLVAFALTPHARGAARGLVAGGRCPLCRFSTYTPEPAPEDLPNEVVACIAQDFADWQPTDGLCRQCADLYRARPMSIAAAERLPNAHNTV